MECESDGCNNEVSILSKLTNLNLCVDCQRKVSDEYKLKRIKQR